MYIGPACWSTLQSITPTAQVAADTVIVYMYVCELYFENAILYGDNPELDADNRKADAEPLSCRVEPPVLR